MKRFVLIIFVGLSALSSAFAQNDKKPEFFAGYSFESINTGISSADLSTTTSLDNRFKANGFELAGAGYFNKHFGVAGDFSAHWDGRTDTFGDSTGQTKFSLYNFTGGPQIRFPGTSRVTPFVHALVGAARRNLTETTGGTSFSDDKTSFAMNLGGGVDYQFKKRVAWRLFQFDYNPVFLRARTVNTTAIPNRTLDGFRFSTGIVFK